MMNWIDALFGHGQSNAAGAMSGQLQQGLGASQGLYNQGQGFLAPFMAREPGEYAAYMDFLNQAKDPNALYNQLSSQYKMSPEAVAQIATGQKNANNASAASGMLGSGEEQTAAANLAQSVRSTDFDKYMTNVLGLRTQYGNGIQGLQNQGFQAAGAGATLAEQQAALQEKYYENMANAAGAQQTGQAGDWANLIGGGLGFAFGGGLPGAALGSSVGGWLGKLFNGGGNGGGSSQWQDPDMLPNPFQ
jgi:hypothetical protein